jgi:competence protein ComEC
MQELDDIHKEPSASLFKALFFAGNIPKDTREKLSALGINHLLAISGFHLAVLSFILFFLVKVIYKPFVGRFYPYRNSHKDIALIVFTLLFTYLYFLNFVPSLLRAFAMSIFAYVLYDRGMKIISFSSLLLVVSFLIAMWPKLLFALGFWFSVMGVVYIFIFLHHMKALKAWQSFILLNFWVYLAMLPLVHYFFGMFCMQQLFSPLLTMLFILFYPLELFLHLINQGARLDFLLEYLLTLKLHSVELFTNIWVLFFYLTLTLLALFKKFFFYALFVFNLGFFGYLLNGVT